MRVATMAATMAAVTTVMAVLLSGCWREEADDIIDNLLIHQMLEEMNEACEAHCDHDDECGAEMYWTTPCLDVCLAAYDELRAVDRWECAEFYTAEYECFSRASCSALSDYLTCEDEWMATLDCLYPED